MKIVFMGTPDFAVPVLSMLVEEGHDVIRVVTQPDRPKGRKRELIKTPVKVEAERHGIPVFQPEKLRDEEAVELAIEGNPDLIVTAAYGQLLPESILTAPQYGAVNVHASLLPAYRGGAPIHQSIIDGQKETGVTIMYMVKRLDAGDMLLQEAVNIEEDDTVGSMHDKLSALGAKLLKETLPHLENGTVQPVQQDEEKVTYAPNIARGAERIDWTKSAQAVHNQIRGMNPWPVAFTMWNGQSLKLWKSELVDEHFDDNPGTVVTRNQDSFIVVAGDQKGVKLLTVQPAGKKAMDASDFLRGKGQSLNVGDVLKDDEK
ncbi:methionyl-tRNA formyltransferase [Bacillaceae bacterium JMAK1]|nr:methionyl-tRNA formyltransferase [Bacillaceae bacterium JMAK1]